MILHGCFLPSFLSMMGFDNFNIFYSLQCCTFLVHLHGFIVWRLWTSCRQRNNAIAGLVLKSHNFTNLAHRHSTHTTQSKYLDVTMPSLKHTDIVIYVLKRNHSLSLYGKPSGKLENNGKVSRKLTALRVINLHCTVI